MKFILRIGDPVLQDMIKRRDSVRRSINSIYRSLSKNKELTVEEYVNLCKKALNGLDESFTDMSLSEEERKKYGSLRKEEHAEKRQTLTKDLKSYKDMFENPNRKMPLSEIIGTYTFVDIRELLQELRSNLNNEVNLYKLKNDIMDMFKYSETLKTLGITVSSDKKRTKAKAKPNGYRSEFVGLDLTITLEDGEVLVLPIECQIQTIEQYEDGQNGKSAHINRDGKKKKLKDIPPIRSRRKIY